MLFKKNVFIWCFTVLTLLCPRMTAAQAAGEWLGMDAARERIERCRKGDMRITVRGRDGLPIPDAVVTVRMTQHAFAFGSALNIRGMFTKDGPKEDAGQYLSVFKDMFNAAVAENAMKWYGLVKDDGSLNLENRAKVMQCMHWLRENRIALRGHNVIWPNWQFSPDYIQDLSHERLREVLYAHLDTTVAYFRGMLTDWDLVNEPVHHRAFMDIFGDQELVYWYRRAHEIDPETPMYVNQWNVWSGKYHDGYLEWVKLLVESGAPVAGIGIQGHVQTEQFIGETNLKKIWDMMNEYAAFGLPIKITEFDCEATNGEDRQAECLENALTLCFSHPAVEGFMLWGFWDGSHWRNTKQFGLDEAGLWRRDWTPKPAADVWRRLIFEEWWTTEKGRTDVDGIYDVRGFFGEYDITVNAGDDVRVVPVSLDKTARPIVITMP